MTPRRRAVLVGLGVLALLGPAVFEPTRRFAGTDWLDSYGTQWFYWWTEQRLLGRDPGPLLFYPWGKDLYRHTGGNLIDAVLAAPLRLTLGPVLGTNAFYAAILGSNAWVGGHLARACGVGRWGQTAAAALALLNPFVLIELQQGRPTQALLLFAGVAVACAVRPPTWRAGLVGGVALALAGLTYWYFGILGGLLAAVVALGRVLGGARLVPEVGRLTLMGVVSLTGVLPFAWPMLTDLQAGQVPGLLALEDPPGALGRLRLRTVEGDDEGLYVVAASGRGGALTQGEGLQFDAGLRVLGLPHLLALGLGMWARDRRVLAAALALVAAGLVVAIGPVLVVGDTYLANPLYLAGVERLDVLRRWWWPGRAVAFVHLGAVLLAGVGVASLASRHGRWAGRVAVLALVATSVVPMVRGGVAPLDSWSAAVSPGVVCLREAPPGAVIELPYLLGQRPLYHQTQHGKPILNGMLVTKEVFSPPEAVALRRDNSVVRLLLKLGERDWRADRQAATAADLRALRELGYRYVVFRKEGYQRPRPQRDGSVRKESDWPRAERIFREVPFLVGPQWQDDELALYTLGEDLALPCAAAP